MVYTRPALAMQWDLLTNLCQIYVKLIGKRLSRILGIYEAPQGDICTLAKER